MAKDIGSQEIKAALVRRFAKEDKRIPKRDIINKLYKKYNKNPIPLLTANNLIQVLRYIKKHHVSQIDYKKVIPKAVAQKPNISKQELISIYNDAERNAKRTGIPKTTVIDMFNDLISGIKTLVNRGKRVRINGLVMFHKHHVNTKKFTIPHQDHTTTTKVIKAHDLPKAKISGAWKAQMKKA